ncbi:MAG: hypothetical protein JSR66_23460 [Proteobacteria bacterium]|nr:hypothetical protein [Pseudomonadota bacterium]
MKYQKTQKGNPHALTVNQHVFPARSIGRFQNPDGRVTVRMQGSDDERLLPPDASLFCAMRVWDHGAEAGFMKDMEDKFQAVAEELIAGRRSLALEQYDVVATFYALWLSRASFRDSPIPDRPIEGVEGLSRTYTLDEREFLEKNAIGFIKPNLSISGRDLASFGILQSINYYRKQLRGKGWGVATSAKAEFIVPDQFSETAIVPVTPRISLVANWTDVQMSEQQVTKQNRLAFAEARKYTIARSFAACPA